MNSNYAKLTLAALAALGGIPGFVHDLHAAVVINEVYGGGGSTNTTTVPTYSSDFVELYNNGTSAVDLTGVTVRYASSNSTAFSTSNTVTLSGTLAAGGYALVQGATSSTYTGSTLPTPDFTSTLALAAASGEVGLLASGATDFSNSSTFLDLIGYGAVKQYETTSTAVLTVNTSAARTTTGVDNNNNLTDFAVTGTITPQGGGVTGQTPEPATLGLVTIGSALVLRRRR